MLYRLSCPIFPGIVWAIIVPGLNQFFFFRYPSVTVTNNVAQLLSFPMGQLWARTVPNWKIFGISINPGPFTIKEHVLVTIMATVGYQSAYAVRLQCSFGHAFDLLDFRRPILSRCRECITTRYSTLAVCVLGRPLLS